MLYYIFMFQGANACSNCKLSLDNKIVRINYTLRWFVCDVTAARVTDVHVTDIGADYVSVTWDALVPAIGNQFVIYEARCVDVDRLLSTDDNHTQA